MLPRKLRSGRKPHAGVHELQDLKVLVDVVVPVAPDRGAKVQ
jgi:hypothetical protein